MLKASVEDLQDATTRKEAKKPARNTMTNGLETHQLFVEMRSYRLRLSQSLSTTAKAQEAVLWRQPLLSKSFQLSTETSRLSLLWTKLSKQYRLSVTTFHNVWLTTGLIMVSISSSHLMK